MTSLVAARAIFPQMFRKELNLGPFVYTLTDLHQSNIFVDEEWNVTCIIDLEFTCSWPIEFLQPPYWLAGKFVDQLEPPDLAPKHADFVEHVRREESQLQKPRWKGTTEPLSSVMQHALADGAFWAVLAFIDPIGFTGVFYNTILPFHFGYSSEADIDKADYRFFSMLWRPGIHDIIDKKLQDRAKYLETLNARFTNT